MTAISSAAPTPNFIISVRASLAVSCDPCRVLRVPHDLALALIAAGRGDVPIDQLVFRCTKCGAVGEPYVTGEGNALIGRERYWPRA